VAGLSLRFADAGGRFRPGQRREEGLAICRRRSPVGPEGSGGGGLRRFLPRMRFPSLSNWLIRSAMKTWILMEAGFPVHRGLPMNSALDSVSDEAIPEVESF